MTLKKLLFKNKKSAFAYALGIVLSAISNISVMLAVANIFRLFEKDAHSILILGAISLGLGLFSVVAQIISRFLRIGFMTDILKDVRLLAYDKIMNLSSEEFAKEDKEAYQSVLISDINLFEKDFFLSLLNIGFSILSIFFSLIIIAYISIEIASIAFVTSILLFVVTKAFEKPTRQKQKETQKQNKMYNQSVSNLVSGSTTIKQYGREAEFVDYFQKEAKTLHTLKSDSFALYELQGISSENIAYLAQILMMILATIKMGQGKMILAQLALVINMSSSVIWGMIQSFNFVNRLKASVDIFDRIVKFESPTEAVFQPTSPLQYAANDLSFSYDEKVNVLEKLNLAIKPGDKVLIHGPSGSGKTTLLNVLSQNLSGYTGDLNLSETSFSKINHQAFLDLSAYIRQSHFMFDDTIKNNIILNRPYNKERYHHVLKQAALDDWLMNHDEIILKNNGSNISGGQKQRISIARALYSDYEVIFIDEPSASLDDDNAKTIYDTIINLDKTVICVSHRHLDYLTHHFDTIISFENSVEVQYETA